MTASSLILASASPRRRELLSQLGVDFICNPADIDESSRSGELPRCYVQRMAQEKAEVVAQSYKPGKQLVLAADTTVVIDDRVLGKPCDLEEGMEMLQRLSGRSHTVLTAICLGNGLEQGCQVVATDVSFVELSPQVCAAYLANGESWDKAGGYAIQGLGGALVSGIRGSYSNVVGLPLAETWQLLKKFGVVTALERSGE